VAIHPLPIISLTYKKE